MFLVALALAKYSWDQLGKRVISLGERRRKVAIRLKSITIGVCVFVLGTALSFADECSLPIEHKMVDVDAGPAAGGCDPLHPDDYFVPEGYGLPYDYMQRTECPEYIDYELEPRCGPTSEPTHCETQEEVLPQTLRVFYECSESGCVYVDHQFSEELQPGFVIASECAPPPG